MLSLEQANAVLLKFDVMPISSLSKEELATLLHAREVMSEAAKRAVRDFLNHESSKKYLKEVSSRAFEYHGYHGFPDSIRVITIQEFHD